MRPFCSLARFVFWFFIGSVIVAPIAAQAIEIKIEAGKSDRKNTPICVPVDKQSEILQQKNLIARWNGKQTAAQITAPALLAGPSIKAELHFVVPDLKAGATKEVEVTAEMAPRAGETFRWEEHPGESIELFFGSRPVLRYQCKPIDESSPAAREQTFKPFHHVFDPAGKQLITKGPGGLYTHHRGLFYGFNKITYGDNRECDVWHCTNGAYQQHEKVISSEAGPVLARHCLAIGWHGNKGELFANEERELTVYNVPGGTLIDFASRVTPIDGKIKFDGDPQHAGFHFRSALEVAEKTKQQTYYLRTDGKGGEGETRNWNPLEKQPDPKTINLPWNALSMVVGGQRYTVEYMDSPKNPKEARYSERDYGRFGSYFVAEAKPEKPLDVRYRIWVQAGEMTVAEAAAKDADFDDPPSVTVN